MTESSVLPAGTAIVVGAGPAGLMAAQVLAEHGCPVTVVDRMPTAGRKLLMAGKSGLNITHSEDFSVFIQRYGVDMPWVGTWLRCFGPRAVQDWCACLGVPTFVGSSGKVFPEGMKAGPLVRAWLQHLQRLGVKFLLRQRCVGWASISSGEQSRDARAWRLSLESEKDGKKSCLAGHAIIFALGGASWPRLGSDGQWVEWMRSSGVGLAPWKPANCGFDISWSSHFSERYAGQALKTIRMALADEHPSVWSAGECMVTRFGLEGGLIYAHAKALREGIERDGRGRIVVDLLPGRSRDRVIKDLSRPRGRDSLATHWRRCLGLEGVKAGLLREVLAPDQLTNLDDVANAIKGLPLWLESPRPLSEAISSAGGVVFEEFDADLMLRRAPGIFCAGEMLDWEAPTGGYLLTACLASGHLAGQSALNWLREPV